MVVFGALCEGNIHSTMGFEAIFIAGARSGNFGGQMITDFIRSAGAATTSLHGSLGGHFLDLLALVFCHLRPLKCEATSETLNLSSIIAHTWSSHARKIEPTRLIDMPFSTFETEHASKPSIFLTF